MQSKHRREYLREYYRQWRLKNPEKARAHTMRWKEKNLERFKEYHRRYNKIRQERMQDMGYTKLFEEILKSSIWSEDNTTRIVWITLLALKDRKHFVRGTVDYLARQAVVSLEDCKKALEKLSAPDPQSHRQEEEGRRIKPMPGGWFIVTGEYYAQKLSLAERREYNKEKQQEYRERKKGIKTQARKAGARRAINEGFADLQGP